MRKFEFGFACLIIYNYLFFLGEIIVLFDLKVDQQNLYENRGRYIKALEEVIINGQTFPMLFSAADL